MRLFIVAALVTVGFVFLVFVIFRIQITDFKIYRKKVVDQLTYEYSIDAERGEILAADGELLAGNTVRYRIFISPQTIIGEAEKIAKNDPDAIKCEGPLDRFIADNLGRICGVDPEEIVRLAAKTGRLDETVVRAADKDTAAEVRKFISEYGLQRLIYLAPSSERVYLYGTTASHVVGFTGTDGNGLYGLEYYYNEQLSGTPGRYIIATDAGNRAMPYEYESFVEAKNGLTLHTTIDMRIQAVLEKQVKRAYDDSEALEGACGIVMNAKTGAVLAMATYPGFDCNAYAQLNDVYAGMLAESGYDEGSTGYNLMKRDLQLQMWSNKAVSYSYIPGSTFKPVTTAIALETDSVKLTDTYTCYGSIWTEDRLVKCSVLWGHGKLTFAEGLQQSCNPWFITAGQKIGTATFYDHFADFGYFAPSGIDLPGEGATQFWERSDFTKINLSMCAFGQNFKVTAIRHLASLGAIANGGYILEPYVVDYITDQNGNTVATHSHEGGRQAVSAKIASTVARILADGVAGNGGSRNAYVAGYRVAAKTGTSEKIGDDEDARICSCMAFAPVDDPEIIMIIMVDHPTKGVIFGSTIAAPYVSAALAEILPEVGVVPKYTEAETAKLNVKIDDWRGMELSEAKAAVESKNLKCEVFGSGDSVTSQIPAAGSTVSKNGGRVILCLGGAYPEADVRMPDLSGDTAQNALARIEALGLNVNAEGAVDYDSASVFSQTPAAGTMLVRGEVVDVTFRYLDVADD